ncbi:hypothetical protein [Micromonospora sp. NPDC047134]|uniref:hypothetical protein n=1 Tax=Micromonospora sp. NPDC047134 TaxID=3154340 RepID=UPI0033D6E88C
MNDSVGLAAHRFAALIAPVIDRVFLAAMQAALRYHRADAHAAAGHTSASIVELPDGAQRRAIELETDRRAAGPYATLTPPQRLEFLADLAALPG